MKKKTVKRKLKSVKRAAPSARPAPKKQPEEAKQFVLGGDVRESMLTYFRTKPYDEVHQIIPRLLSLPQFVPQGKE